MAKRMKRKQSEDCAPSSATPGQEPPPAETPAKSQEMGNQHAIGEWWDPVTSSAGRLKDQASKPVSKADPAAMSEEQLEALSPQAGQSLEPSVLKDGTLVRLCDGIEVPIERLDRYALALAAQHPKMDWVEEIIPLACQRLGQMSGFLSGVHPAELEFATTHGRRWKPGEGIILQADVLIFDPALAKESCKVFRELKGTLLPVTDAALIRRIWECHEIYSERREQLGQKRRFPPSGEPGALADTFYPGFEGPVFIGKEIEGLKRYMNIRFAHARSAGRAKQLFLAGSQK
jgi:hypothetical protein